MDWEKAFSVGAKLFYKPSLEKLTERLALATDLGQFCESLPAQIVTVNDATAAEGIGEDFASPALVSPTVVSVSPVDALIEGEADVPNTVDPDGNGRLDEDDALFMLFVMNDDGMGQYKPLFDLPLDREFVSGADLQEELHAMRWNACNVNQDIYLSPLDLLIVVNQINQQKLLQRV